MGLDNAAAQLYLKAQGVHCPYCKSIDIEDDGLDVDGAVATADVMCLDCDQEWRDTYVLTAISTLDDKGNAVDTFTLDNAATTDK